MEQSNKGAKSPKSPRTPRNRNQSPKTPRSPRQTSPASPRRPRSPRQVNQTSPRQTRRNRVYKSKQSAIDTVTASKYNLAGKLTKLTSIIPQEELSQSNIITKQWNYFQKDVRKSTCTITSTTVDNIDPQVLKVNLKPKKMRPSNSKISENNEYKILINGQKNFKLLRHNMVASGIDGNFFETDKRLADFMPIVDKEDDRLTPDFIQIIDNKIIILELKTSKGGDLSHICKEALTKYLIPIATMLENNTDFKYEVYLHAIVVSFDKIYSTFDVGIGLAEGLCDLFRIGCSMENILRGKNVKIDDEVNDFEVNFMDILNENDYELPKKDKKCFISQQMVDNWKNFDKTTFHDVIAKEVKESYDSLKEELGKKAQSKRTIEQERKQFNEWKNQNYAYDDIDMVNWCPEYKKLYNNIWFDGAMPMKKRMDYKTVIQFPLLSQPLTFSPKIQIGDIGEKTYESAIGRLWQNSIAHHGVKGQNIQSNESKITEIMAKGYVGELRNYSGGEFPVNKKQDIRQLSKKDLDKLLEWKKQEYELSRKNRLELESDIIMKKMEYRRMQKEFKAFSDTLDFESTEQAHNLKTAAQERNHNSRVEVEIPYDDRIKFAKRGFQGKAFKNNPKVEEKKKKSKVPFDFETPTSDIHECVSDIHWWYQKSSDKEFIDEEIFKLYIQSLMDLPGKTGNFYDKTKEELDYFGRTRIGVFCNNIGKIIEEINISLTQYCAVDELIIKKIGDLDCFLLIKPTRPDRQIFYSIMMPRDCVESDKWGRIFQKTIPYNEKYVMTNFCSLNRNRISHLLFPRESMAAIWTHWVELSMSILNDQNREQRIEIAKRHTVGSMLFYFETKAKSAEVALLSRYMYMECTSESLFDKNGMKICEKFSPYPRSRFTLFIMKRIIYAALLMKYNEPKSSTSSSIDDHNKELGEKASDSFRNIVSWITLDELDSYSKVLYCSYLGVLRNKDEGDEHQGNYKIFEKIGIEELKLEQDDEKDIGWRDPIKTGGHRFSPSYVIMCGKSIRDYISKKNGSFDGWFRSTLMKVMEKRKWEDIATFKASAVKNNSYFFHETKDEMNKRIRALEGVLSVLRNRKPGASPSFRGLDDLIEKLGTEYEKAELNKILTPEDHLVSDMDRDFRQFYDDREQNRSYTKDGKQENYTHVYTSTLYEVCRHLESPMLTAIQAIKWVEEREKDIKNHAKYESAKAEDENIDLGGIHANLFKKQQITGPREIFVLDILSRLVILFVETICRMINTELPWEMLTKGTEKVKRSEEHYADVEELKRSKNYDVDLTSADSLDKTTWCQKFTMPLFACLFYGILDQEDEFQEKIFNCMCRIYNLAANKRLELPKSMLEDFIDAAKITIRSMSAVVNRMKDEFRGDEKAHRLINAFMVFLKNLTNMMQGIFHQNSSTLHAGHVLLMMKLFKKYGQLMLDLIQPNIFLYAKVTFKVSSDDSSFLQTVLMRVSGLSKETVSDFRVKAAIVLTQLSILEEKCAKQACMFLSESKSTRCSFAGIEEFNSLWTVRNIFLSPTIKFIYAALKPKVTSSMEDRIRIFCELRKQVMENCGSFYLNNAIQICQMLIHYRMLGSRTCPLFSYYSSLISTLKTPSLGWFPMDLANFNGMFAYNISLANLLHSSKQCRVTSKWIYDTRGTATSEEGKPSIKISLVIGSKIRYRRFLQNVGTPSNYERIAEAKPWMLLGESHTLLDSVFKIYKKAMTPSSAQAFSFQPPSKMQAASAYILDRASMSKREKIDNVWENRWSSLINFCYEAAVEIYGKDCITVDFKSNIFIIDESKVPDVDITRMETLLFPSLSQQKDITSIADQMSTATVLEIGRLANRIVSLTLPIMTQRSAISFARNAERVWFPEHTKRRGTSSEHKYAKIFFQQLFDWYKDSFKETISNTKDFPFNGWITMMDFIKSVDDKPPTIKLSSPVRRGLNMINTVTNFMKFNYANGYVLTFGKIKMDKTSTELAKASVIISRFLSSYEAMLPDSLMYLDLLISRYRTMVNDIRLGDLLKERCSDTEFITYIILRSFSGSQTLKFEEIKNCVYYLRKGMITYYQQPQYYDSISMKYTGRGVIGVIIDSCHTFITVDDDKVTNITTDSLRSFSQVPNRIVRFIQKMNIRFNRFIKKKEDDYTNYVFLDQSGAILSRPSTFCIKIDYEPGLKVEEIKGSIKMKILWGKGIKLYQELNDRKITIGFLSAENPFETERLIEQYEDIPQFYVLTNQYIRGESLDAKEVRKSFERVLKVRIDDLIYQCMTEGVSINLEGLIKKKYEEDLIQLVKDNRKNVDSFWPMIKEMKTEAIRVITNELKGRGKFDKNLRYMISEINSEYKERIVSFKNNLQENLMAQTTRYNFATKTLDKIRVNIRSYCLIKWLTRMHFEVLSKIVGIDAGKYVKENMNYTKSRLNYDGSVIEAKMKISELEVKIGRKLPRNKVKIEESFSSFMKELVDKLEKGENVSIGNWADVNDQDEEIIIISDDEDEIEIVDEVKEEFELDDTISTVKTQSSLSHWKEFLYDQDRSIDAMYKCIDIIVSIDSDLADQFVDFNRLSPENVLVINEYFNLIAKKYSDTRGNEDVIDAMVVYALSYSDSGDFSDNENIISKTISELSLQNIVVEQFTDMINSLPQIDEKFVEELLIVKPKPLSVTYSHIPEYFRSNTLFEKDEIRHRDGLMAIINSSNIVADDHKINKIVLLCGRTLVPPLKPVEPSGSESEDNLYGDA
jgi:hypothetical protein